MPMVDKRIVRRTCRGVNASRCKRVDVDPQMQTLCGATEMIDGCSAEALYFGVSASEFETCIHPVVLLERAT